MKTSVARGPYREDPDQYWPLYFGIDPDTGILTIVCDTTDTEDYTNELEAGFKQRVADLLHDSGISWSAVTGKEAPVSSGKDGPSFWQITAQLETIDLLTTLRELLTTEVMDHLRKQLRPTCETRAAVLVTPLYSRGMYTGMLIHLEPAEGAPSFIETASLITDGEPSSPHYIHMQRTPKGSYYCVLPQPFDDPIAQAARHAHFAALKLGAVIVDYVLTEVPNLPK